MQAAAGLADGISGVANQKMFANYDIVWFKPPPTTSRAHQPRRYAPLLIDWRMRDDLFWALERTLR
jgi:hypothetical protein